MAGEAVISSTSPACRRVLHTPVDRRGAIWWGPWNFAASFHGGVLEMSVPDSSSGNKQTSCLVAAGIGCLAIVLLVGLAIVGMGYAGYRGFRSIAKNIGTDARKEAAIMVLEAIPLVKVVKEDDAAHQVTISGLNSAEEETISFEDAMAGKFQITDAKRVQAMVNTQERVELSGPEGQKIVVGSVADTAPPAWIPTYGERDLGGINVRVENGKIVSGGLYDTHGGLAGGCEELFREGFRRRKLQVEFIVQIQQRGAGRHGHAGDRRPEEDQGRGDVGGERENGRVDQLRGTEAVGRRAMLRSLKIRHFRCFDAFEASFAPELNLIVGPNARGKTSLLEAIAVMLRLQSPRTSRLGDVVQHGQRGFVVDGYFAERHMQFYFSTKRKKLALDSVEQKTAREYLQVGRLMYFETADIEIVRGSAEARRRFLDFVAAQKDAAYRKALRDYERALRSRNSLLKAPSPRWPQIDAFNEPLLAAGEELTRGRKQLVADLQPQVAEAHHAISTERETLELEYRSGSGEDFPEALAGARAEDARLRQTTVGPHRDDVAFVINGQPSRFASEGQQRTLVLSLKLAAAELLHEHFGTAPLLLLDDIVGELDLSRRAALLRALPGASQKIITTTHLDWVPHGWTPNLLCFD